MTGHVFHPGHHELHGITVVLETKDGFAYIGRFDREDDDGVLLHDVAVHRDQGPGHAEFVERTRKFGVRTEREQARIPRSEVLGVSRLTAWAEGSQPT